MLVRIGPAVSDIMEFQSEVSWVVYLPNTKQTLLFPLVAKELISQLQSVPSQTVPLTALVSMSPDNKTLTESNEFENILSRLVSARLVEIQ
ncbi:hypothetical protein [Aliiglaciecola sp. CAU 1673]|uniref:hypothetical protein n=1 Tax=Aliiglaciecola sp. CAU 1673 TaxID=3032595 RepID=UPI0023D9E34B|nr:hypothetical protein [Aliiglaciecola sp. CAU 1673]